MKHYLYEIDCDGAHLQSFPFMPRVLAEKTARQLNKDCRKLYGYQRMLFGVSKTCIETKDGTPHGLKHWTKR